MTLTSRIKLIKKLDTTDMSGEKVMIDFETGKYFLLKGVANDIWEYIQQDVSVSEVNSRLIEAYEVDPLVCENSVSNFLGQLESYGFIQILN